jgi:hypothetical protein
LKTIVLDKSRLQRMERFAVREPLDRCDGLAVMHCGERQTRVDAAPVEQHRASAALTVIATLLGSREREMFTQSVDKSCPRIEHQSMQLSVHSEFDTYWSHRLGVGPLGGQRKPRETTEQESGCDGPGRQNRSSGDPSASVSVFIHDWRLRSWFRSAVSRRETASR